MVSENKGPLTIILALILLSVSGSIRAAEYDEARYCLAQNIYFEAANQSFAGKLAVAHVVMNRVDDLQFPNTVCEVVYQSKKRENWLGNMVPIRNQCQFSWYCDGLSDEPVDSKTWINAIRISNMVLEEIHPDITEGSLYYHADFVNPYWSDELLHVATIDNHLFYK